MALKPGPKRIATSTGEPDRRQKRVVPTCSGSNLYEGDLKHKFSLYEERRVSFQETTKLLGIRADLGHLNPLLQDFLKGTEYHGEIFIDQSVGGSICARVYNDDKYYEFAFTLDGWKQESSRSAAWVRVTQPYFKQFLKENDLWTTSKRTKKEC